MKEKYCKGIGLMAALLVVLSFTGCGQQQNKSEVVTEQPTQTTSSSNETVISDSVGSLSVEDAKAIALNDAELTADEVNFVIAEFDNDVYVPHYDIEFTADGYEYDYEINAETGTIIGFDKELDDNEKQAQADSSDYITAEKAKDIVLQHTGLSEKDISGYKCKLDVDDLIAHFEIEFTSGQYEYEYEINAKTGDIMCSEKELDD